MSNTSSKTLNTKETKTNKILTEEEEDILQNLLKKKDLEFLIEKKDFYKEQIMNLHDIELKIQKFQETLQTEISVIQKMLFSKCDHEWVKCSDGGYDESPDYICCICDSEYGY